MFGEEAEVEDTCKLQESSVELLPSTLLVRLEKPYCVSSIQLVRTRKPLSTAFDKEMAPATKQGHVLKVNLWFFLEINNEIRAENTRKLEWEGQESARSCL